MQMPYSESNGFQRTIRAPGFGNLERRAIDASDNEFQNCFLSPVQCMLPRSFSRK